MAQQAAELLGRPVDVEDIKQLRREEFGHLESEFRAECDSYPPASPGSQTEPDELPSRSEMAMLLGEIAEFINNLDARLTALEKELE